MPVQPLGAPQHQQQQVKLNSPEAPPLPVASLPLTSHCLRVLLTPPQRAVTPPPPPVALQGEYSAWSSADTRLPSALI